VAQRSGSLPPSPRTVKSGPLHFLEGPSFRIRLSAFFSTTKVEFITTHGRCQIPTPVLHSSKIAGFCSGSRLGGAWPSVAQRGWNLPHPVEAVKSRPSCSHDPAASRFVRCSPVHGATRGDYTVISRSSQIRRGVLLDSTRAQQHRAERRSQIPDGSTDGQRCGFGVYFRLARKLRREIQFYMGHVAYLYTNPGGDALRNSQVSGAKLAGAARISTLNGLPPRLSSRYPVVHQ
jgi:hypothetical protein